MHMKICPSCMAEVRENEESCPKCGWQFPKIPTKLLKPDLNSTKVSEIKSEVTSNRINKGVKQPEKVEESHDSKEMCHQNKEFLDTSKETLNLGICIDRTGSSELFQQGIYSCCKQIFNKIEPEYNEIRCWMQSHGDLDYDEEIILHTDGDSPQQALDDISMLTYEGGGDLHETHLDAIEHMLKILPPSQNQQNSLSALVVFITSDTKPAKSGISAEELGAEIADAGLNLYTICEVTPTLKHLCDAAGGFLFPITINPNPEEISQISKQIGAHIRSKKSQKSL